MKKTILMIFAAVMTFASCNSQKQETPAARADGEAVVYLTKDISPEALVNIYKALGVEAKGRVAVKVSTGEGSNPNYLKPELIKDLVLLVDGTIVECNTAYSSGSNDLLSRIDQQHGTHTIDWAEKIGLGTKKYKIVDIDK